MDPEAPPVGAASLSEQISSNKRRAALQLALLIVVVLALIGTLSLLVGLGAVGPVLALVMGFGAAVVAWWRSEGVALGTTRAQPSTPESHPRLHNLVEGLCAAAGLPKPRVYVVDDPALNAFAAGRGPASASVAVTTGLLEGLTRIELEGALAHELSHVKNHDILPATLAVTVLWPVTALSGRLPRMAAGRRRELLADLGGVTLTRYPPGLIAALEKLQAGVTEVRSASRATAHLWMAPPLARTGADGGLAWSDRLFDTHPPLEDRIQALKEL